MSYSKLMVFLSPWLQNDTRLGQLSVFNLQNPLSKYMRLYTIGDLLRSKTLKKFLISVLPKGGALPRFNLLCAGCLFFFFNSI